MIVGQYKIKFGSCIKNKDKSRILTRLLKKVDVSDAIKFKNIDFYRKVNILALGLTKFNMQE